MGHVQEIDSSFPLIDLTDEASSCNHTVQHLDLSRIGSGTVPSPELIDLTNDNRSCTSNIPIIDLTGDSDQLHNYRIPVNDLTNDDVQDITCQAQCTDLTSNDPFRSNHTIRNLKHEEKDGTNPTKKPINLADDHLPVFNQDTPIVDLTCDNDQILCNRIQDMTDDVFSITQELHSFDLTHDTQQNQNECITPIGFLNTSDKNIDQIFPVTDLTSDKDCSNGNKPAIDNIQNDVVDKFADKEMPDLCCNNLFPNFHKDFIESNLRISAANPCCTVIENRRNPQKLHGRKETIFSNDPTSNSFDNKKEAVLTNQPPTNNSKERRINLTNSFDKKCLILANHEKISQNFSSDLPKPAHHPIPLRHSLGRSTVNTSQHVPIECAELPEGQSTFGTVSSIMRRKKMNSKSDISKSNLCDSSEPSTSRENTFSYGSFKEVFLQFWIFLFLVFVGLYYWI